MIEILLNITQSRLYKRACWKKRRMEESLVKRLQVHPRSTSFDPSYLLVAAMASVSRSPEIRS